MYRIHPPKSWLGIGLLHFGVLYWGHLGAMLGESHSSNNLGFYLGLRVCCRRAHLRLIEHLEDSTLAPLKTVPDLCHEAPSEECNWWCSKEVWKSKFRHDGQMEKQRWSESEKRREEKRREEKSRAEQSRGEERREEKRREEKKREEQRRSDKRKSAKRWESAFPMSCGSRGSKSRLAKAAGAEPCGQMREEKVHAVVAQSTFSSQNAQNTTCSDHFWKLRCRKSARRCGAKHISKSKCTKHTILGPLLEVAMSKECTPLWCEADFQVKSAKNWAVWNTFGRSHVVLRGRRRDIAHLVKNEQDVRFCSSYHQFQKRWQAWWDIWRRSGKMHFAWQALYKRHTS